MTYRILIGSIMLLVLAGCATVPTRERFEETKAGVKERTGYTIEWNEVSAPYETVHDAIQGLLDDGLTDEEAAQVALLANPRMQAVYAEYGVAVAELVEAGLLKNPIFSGEMRYLTSSVQIFEFEIVQDFLDILLTPLRKAQKRRELERARLRLTAEVIDLAMDTKRAFHHYQADEQLVALWRAHVLANEAAFEMAVKLREAGNIPQLMVADWQARYEDARLELARAEDDMAAGRERLNRLMGIWGGAASWETANRLPAVPVAGFDVEALERRALERSLDLGMAWMDVEVATRLKRIRSLLALLPELEIGAGFEGEEPEQIELRKRQFGDEKEYRLKESRGSRRWEVGPALTMPIPIWNQGQAERAAGRARVRRQWEQHAALAIELRSAARVAGYRLDNARRRATYAGEVNIPVYHARMHEAQLQYNAMFIGVFELLETKMEEIHAGRKYLMDLCDYWLAHTDMQQILMGRMVVRAPEDRPDIVRADVLVGDTSERNGEGHP
jgi:outer membrane protein, heavy metal efflux system